MKLKLLTVFLFLSCMVYGQQNTEYINKVNTIDSTIATLYDVISGEKGEARNWELFKYLFHPQARLIPSGISSEGVANAQYITPEAYIESSGNWLIENGFFEKEIHRETDRFGSIAQVFSTYESFRSEKDSLPFMRGINSIQLLHDGTRWWIINIYWSQETDSNSIPATYFPKQ